MRLNPVTRQLLNATGEIDQRDLAERLGVARSTVACTLNNHSHNPELQERIAEIYGLPVRGLWGAWYDPARRRSRPRRSRGGHGRRPFSGRAAPTAGRRRGRATG